MNGLGLNSAGQSPYGNPSQALRSPAGVQPIIIHIAFTDLVHSLLHSLPVCHLLVGFVCAHQHAIAGGPQTQSNARSRHCTQVYQLLSMQASRLSWPCLCWLQIIHSQILQSVDKVYVLVVQVP